MQESSALRSMPFDGGGGGDGGDSSSTDDLPAPMWRSAFSSCTSLVAVPDTIPEEALPV